jgi:hypothetical protein
LTEEDLKEIFAFVPESNRRQVEQRFFIDKNVNRTVQPLKMIAGVIYQDEDHSLDWKEFDFEIEPFPFDKKHASKTFMKIYAQSFAENLSVTQQDFKSKIFDSFIEVHYQANQQLEQITEVQKVEYEYGVYDDRSLTLDRILRENLKMRVLPLLLRGFFKDVEWIEYFQSSSKQKRKLETDFALTFKDLERIDESFVVDLQDWILEDEKIVVILDQLSPAMNNEIVDLICGEETVKTYASARLIAHRLGVLDPDFAGVGAQDWNLLQAKISQAAAIYNNFEINLIKGLTKII